MSADGSAAPDGASGEPASAEATDEPTTVEVDNPLEASRSFYQSRPHFQQPFPKTEVPKGLQDLSAETCGNCHEEMYREWKVSTHARAWTDPQFRAELKKSRGHHSGDDDGTSGDDVGWMCVNCHAPLKNQLERLVVGLEDDNIGKPKYVDNPSYSPGLENEGITCASCHVRDGKVYGPYGDTDAPHPTAKDQKFLNEKVCTQCHQAEAKWPSRNLACFFRTGEEWRASKYAERGESCQTCHMPKVERRLTVGSSTPKRETRRHWFGGSLIPKRPEYREELEPLQNVYGSGAKIEVLGPGQLEGKKGWGTPEHGLLEGSSCPEGATCKTVGVRITNAWAGHRLPTGDPERHIDVRVRATDGSGEVVASAEQRIASKYKWWPDIVLQYDNRLAPGGHLTFPLVVPTSALPVTLTVVGRKYRMYESAYRHHDLEGRYVRGRRFHRSRWQVEEDWQPVLQTITDDWGERETLLPASKRKEEK